MIRSKNSYWKSAHMVSRITQYNTLKVPGPNPELYEPTIKNHNRRTAMSKALFFVLLASNMLFTDQTWKPMLMCVKYDTERKN